MATLNHGNSPADAIPTLSNTPIDLLIAQGYNADVVAKAQAIQGFQMEAQLLCHRLEQCPKHPSQQGYVLPELLAKIRTFKAQRLIDFLERLRSLAVAEAYVPNVGDPRAFDKTIESMIERDWRGPNEDTMDTLITDYPMHSLKPLLCSQFEESIHKMHMELANMKHSLQFLPMEQTRKTPTQVCGILEERKQVLAKEHAAKARKRKRARQASASNKKPKQTKGVKFAKKLEKVKPIAHREDEDSEVEDEVLAASPPNQEGSESEQESSSSS